MPNTMTQFGFVKKTGDTMTGKLTLSGSPVALDVGLNLMALNNGVDQGAHLQGGIDHTINIRDRLNTAAGHLNCYHVTTGGLVDGVHVSEIGKPAGGLYLVSDQLNIPNVTATLVELDNEIPDFGDGIENKVTHRITPAVAGFYMIIGQLTYSSVVADHNYMATIRRDGSAELAKSIIHAASADDLAVVTGTIAYLSDSNYIELVAYHSAGVDTVDIESAAGVTFLTLERLR